MAVDIYIRKNRPTKNDNLFFRRESKIENDIFSPACAHKRVAQLERWVAWPSGLRRWFKAPVLSRAWVRIPPLPNNLFPFLACTDDQVVLGRQPKNGR